MFDIGFAELLVIAVVALLVIGPERLPRVARTAGMWVGRARRFVSTVKADIDRELAAESQSLYDIVEDTRNSLDPQAGAASAEKNKDNTAVADKSHDTNG